MGSKLHLGHSYDGPDVDPYAEPVTKTLLGNQIPLPQELKWLACSSSLHQLETIHLEHGHDCLLDIVTGDKLDLLRKEDLLSTPRFTRSTTWKKSHSGKG